MQTINPGDNTDLCSVPLPVQNYHNHHMLLGRETHSIAKRDRRLLVLMGSTTFRINLRQYWPAVPFTNVGWSKKFYRPQQINSSPFHAFASLHTI